MGLGTGPERLDDSNALPNEADTKPATRARAARVIAERSARVVRHDDRARRGSPDKAIYAKVLGVTWECFGQDAV